MPREFGAGRSFVSGETDTDRIRIYYYLRESDHVLCAKVWFGHGAEGPPGHAHGGSMAAVLDEAMGFACWVLGHPVVAATVTIHFRRRLPLETICLVECGITETADNKVRTWGRIHDLHGHRVYSEGEGLYIKQPLDSFGKLVKATELIKDAQQLAKGAVEPAP
jgi:acyl-coenzyme A thioesterase PaaI-like protein